MRRLVADYCAAAYIHPPMGETRIKAERAEDQRTASTYIFGAICPKQGKGAALVVDRAGWHMTDKLVIPPNITLVPLPAKCPELNPAGDVWWFLRDNWLSNRVFKSYDDIVDHCCDAWNKLVDQPWRIMSIGLRDWAHRF